MSEPRTLAQTIAAICAEHGVARIFGVPGGGSSLDLIRAFAERNISFVLARTEAAAAIMAAATAEATGTIGVVITTQGPGTASAANGIAHASLDRAPVFLISDGWTARQAAFDTHQVFDQRGLLAPITKASSRLEGDDPAEELQSLITLMKTEPWGPVYLEITGEHARRTVRPSTASVVEPARGSSDAESLAAACDLLGSAHRPVILVWFEARGPDIGRGIL